MAHYSSDDKPVWFDGYKILTQTQLNITALHMMGYANFGKAFSPLESHYHHVREFVVILKGRQQYTVNDRLYTLQGGDIFMTLPEEVHGGNQISQEICEFIWFQLDLSSSKNFLDLKSPYSDYLFQQLCSYEKRFSHTTQENLRLLSRAFLPLHSGNPLEHLKGYNDFLAFIINTLCSDEPASADSEWTSVISTAADYMKAHLYENPTLEMIAKHCGLSPSNLYSKFKEQMGITPHTYATMLKIDIAKKLLKDPANSVTDVAFQLNFASSNHFSSVFRKYTGDSPTLFRQRSQLK